MKYAIADHFSEHARRAAVQALYLSPDELHETPRTADGFCPIGVMLMAEGVDAPPAPLPIEILSRLAPPISMETVERFVMDWDHGQIGADDLYEALGVERGQP